MFWKRNSSAPAAKPGGWSFAELSVSQLLTSILNLLSNQLLLAAMTTS
jgi:hypothetical protein